VHLKTVAEFVENDSIRAMAKKIRVSFAQVMRSAARSR
jgi:hypothetical protein